MIDLNNPNMLIFAGALVFGLLLVWYLFGRSSAPRERSYKPDVLDEGAAPAARNQALIDAPPAAKIEPVIAPAPTSAPEPVPVAAPEPAPASKPAPKPKAEPKPKAAPKPKGEPKPKAEPVAKAEPKPKAAPKPKAELKPKAEAKPVAAAPAGPDDLSRIKGLGPKLQKLLPELGITTFAQIAAMTEADLAELDTKLGAFAGRPAKDSWVEQAKFLAAGDTAGFESKFGKF
ncbi:MAG: hypothetical protein ACOY7T_05585 [Pseudomonadota bacterium]